MVFKPVNSAEKFRKTLTVFKQVNSTSPPQKWSIFNSSSMESWAALEQLTVTQVASARTRIKKDMVGSRRKKARETKNQRISFPNRPEEWVSQQSTTQEEQVKTMYKQKTTCRESISLWIRHCRLRARTKSVLPAVTRQTWQNQTALDQDQGSSQEST